MDKVELQAWLKTQPREVLALIAARAALRVLPVLSAALSKNDLAAETIALKLFRATSLCWVGCRWGAERKFIPSAVISSTANAASRAARLAASPAATSASPATANAAASAAFAFNSFAFTESAAYFSSKAVTSARTAAKASGSMEASKSAYAVTVLDCKYIQAKGTAAELADLPFWHDKGVPGRIVECWLDLRQKLSRLNQDWEVWTDWYEARLEGRPANEPLEIARVTLPEDLWEQGAAAVNARIKELIADRSAPREELDLEQRPAPYAFGWQNDRIEAEPMREAPVDPDIAEDILDDLREKASAALSGLKGNHADPRLIASVSSFLDCIQGRAAEIREGRLLMRFRALEADALAFSDPSSGREKSISAIVTDLAASAEDLISLYPKLRVMEANRLAMRFKVDESNYAAFRKAIDDLTAVAETSPVVGPSAVEALRDGTDEQLRLTAVIEGHSGERARAEAIEKRSIIAGLQALDVRNFVSSALKRCGEELNDIGTETLKQFRADLPKTLSGLLNSGVKVAAIALVVGIGPKVVALGLVIVGFDRLGRWAQEVKDALDDKEDTSADGDDLIDT